MGNVFNQYLLDTDRFSLCPSRSAESLAGLRPAHAGGSSAFAVPVTGDGESRVIKTETKGEPMISQFHFFLVNAKCFSFV